MKQKKSKKPWYESVIEFCQQEDVEDIPIITGIFKGDQSVKIGPTIKKVLLRQMQVIQQNNPKRYQVVTDVERAALNIGVSVLYALEVDDDTGFREICDEEDKFTLKMQALDDFVRTMGKMFSCWEANVFSDNDVENLRKFHEIQDRHLERMKKLGLKKQAEAKLKQIKHREKITNLMECKTHGGKRK
jgi:hypothetical protein